MINRRRITNICDNCNTCGLPVITCICNSISKVETKSKFIILSSEREIYRNTNTASLLKLINSESTEIVIWRRGENSQEILNYINNDIYKVYLIFPIVNGCNSIITSNFSITVTILSYLKRNVNNIP